MGSKVEDPKVQEEPREDPLTFSEKPKVEASSVHEQSEEKVEDAMDKDNRELMGWKLDYGSALEDSSDSEHSEDLNDDDKVFFFVDPRLLPGYDSAYIRPLNIYDEDDFFTKMVKKGTEYAVEEYNKKEGAELKLDN
ncbi:hypothetical protein JCGZ_24869 [Jatropha curcas]|uniref:Uncharacterized protein n=1 Tax=Jatropha curcas TaxID=180498 RepID=A0A067L8P5_JATCU|nr:hypothetical protein JCGZ_24869 [Jatropha curcas]